MKTGYASLRPGSQATPALSKKEHAEKEVSRLRARPPIAAAPTSFLKKLEQNFQSDSVYLKDKSKFEALAE